MFSYTTLTERVSMPTHDIFQIVSINDIYVLYLFEKQKKTVAWREKYVFLYPLSIISTPVGLIDQGWHLCALKVLHN